MELWEHPGARVDTLIITASRAEVEHEDIGPALAMLQKMLKPEVAKRVRGKLIFAINGYDDDPRELHQIAEVRSWVAALDLKFPYWLYFMDTGPRSTLAFVAFSLCQYERVPGGWTLPAKELGRFLAEHFIAMNELAKKLGDSPDDLQGQSLSVGQVFTPH